MSPETLIGFACCAILPLIFLCLFAFIGYRFATRGMRGVALGAKVRRELASVQARTMYTKQTTSVVTTSRADAPIGLCIVSRSMTSVRGLGANLTAEQARQVAALLRQAAGAVEREART